MSHRFLRRQFVQHLRTIYLSPIIHATSSIHNLRQTKCITIASYLHHNTIPYSSRAINTNQRGVDLDVSDLFSSSDDDDSDLSDVSDDESEQNKDNTTTQKHVAITPKYESCRVIISNLHNNVNTADLTDLCSKYGDIKDIYIPIINKNNDAKHRGFGYVSFNSKEQSMNAIANINGTILYEKVLRAGYAKADQRTQRKTVKETQHNKRSYNETNIINDVLEFEDNVLTDIDHKQSKKLTETTVNINGLPNNVKVHQIKRMFHGIGKCLSVYVYEYEQFETKFINAVVKLDLESLSFYNNDDQKLIVDVLQPMSIETLASENEEKQNIEGDSLHKELHSQTKRRQKHVQKPVEVQGVEHQAILSANLDEMLNNH